MSSNAFVPARRLKSPGSAVATVLLLGRAAAWLRDSAKGAIHSDHVSLTASSASDHDAGLEARAQWSSRSSQILRHPVYQPLQDRICTVVEGGRSLAGLLSPILKEPRWARGFPGPLSTLQIVPLGPPHERLNVWYVESYIGTAVERDIVFPPLVSHRRLRTWPPKLHDPSTFRLRAPLTRPGSRLVPSRSKQWLMLRLVQIRVVVSVEHATDVAARN